MKAKIGIQCYFQTKPGALVLPGLPNLVENAMEVFRSRTGNLAMVLQALLQQKMFEDLFRYCAVKCVLKNFA